jgi:DNA-binding CsgD family transcriptional regulator
MPGTFVLRCSSAPYVSYVISTGSFIVGRSRRCDLVVDHPSVSRRHAAFQVEGARVSVTDLGSLNGTYIDNQPVRSRSIVRGQNVRLGRVSFHLGVECSENGVQKAEVEETGRLSDGSHFSAEAPFPPLKSLSEAQRRVFDLLLCGQPEKTIARRLALSRHTVHNHVRAIFKAFAVHSRAELLARMLQTNGTRHIGE